MPSKVRILAIAPYKSMKSSLLKVSEGYKNIELTITIGDLRRGLEVAQSNFHGNYDVIISRGGTARLIQKFVSLPVIEITTSAYDILRALKLACADTKKVAVVGFSNIIENLLSLRKLLPYKVDVFSISSKNETSSVLKKLNSEMYDSVLCDMITYTTAREFDMNAFLITSGIESLKTAIDTSISYCTNYNHLRSENHFLRQLIHGKDSNTIVFAANGKLLYSTLSDNTTAVLDILREKINKIPSNGKRYFVHRKGKTLYSIHSKKFLSEKTQYTVFYIRTSTSPNTGNRCGVSYSNFEDVRKNYFDSTYSVIGSFPGLTDTISKINQNLYPVIISGESGTGKKQIAKIIYLKSSIKDHPFVEINCSLVDFKIWKYLLNHHNSPLCDSGNTIFFKDIDILSEDYKRQLLNALVDMEISKRNRIILSCTNSSEKPLDSNIMEFVNELRCFILNLPTLRSNKSRIDSIVNLYLNKINIDMSKQFLGVSEEAMKMLREFDWPYNYTQFSRVVQDLAIMSSNTYISSEEVTEVLEKEKNISPTSFYPKSHGKPIDISLPLSKINKNIALEVLNIFSGNQTKAAKSLGISRTTLWRMIKSK